MLVKLVSITNGCHTNGVVRFLEFFLINKVFFEKAGVRISIDIVNSYALNSNQSGDKDKNLHVSQKKTMIRARLKEIVLNYFVGALLVGFVKNYIKGLMVCIKSAKNNVTDIYFYQDVFVAMIGLYMHSARSKKITIYHSGVDVLSQFFLSYPALKNTVVERYMQSQMQEISNRMSAVVVLGDNIKNALKKEYPKANVKRIYNTVPWAIKGYDCSENKRETNKINVVCVGSLQKRKGFDLVVKAMTILKPEERNKINVVIVGGGEEYEYLKNYIEVNELSNCVVLAGKQQNVKDYLEQADVFLLPSRNEGLPLALLEAMYCKLPIIATKVGSIPEIFMHKDAILISPEENDLAYALRMLFDGTIDLNYMAQRSRMLYDEYFHQEKFVTNYIELFDSVCNG